MAETLGDLLKTFANQQLSTAEEGSEAIASTNAFIPGFPKKDMTEAVNDESELRSPEAGFDIHDISLGAKKALEQYTAQRLVEGSTSNSYPQLGTQDGTVGHGREDTLRREPADGSSFYEPGYLASSGKTNYRPAGGDLTKLIDDKRIREDRDSLGRRLKNLNVDGPSTFGKRLKANTADTEDAINLASFSLLSDNKYNPSSNTPFLRPAGEAQGDQQLSKGMYSLYTGLLGASKDSNGSIKRGVTVQDLRKAALEILHRAQGVGVDNAAIQAREQLRRGSPFGIHAELLALIPHGPQTGAGTVPGGVNRLRIRSTEAAAAFSYDLKAAGNDDLIAIQSFETNMGFGGEEDKFINVQSRNAASYGTMNSPAEPFNGVAPFGMIMPVIYAIVVLGLVGLGLGAMIAGFASLKEYNALTPENPSELQFGINARAGTDYKGAEIGQKFLNMFGLPRDVGLEFFSMVRGIMLFYGIDVNPFTPGAAIADAFINLLMGPGYYLVISKKVLADFEQITKAFANYSNIQGPFSAITIILSSIEALMSSFTTRFFVIMNTVGRIDEDSRLRGGAKAHGTTVMSVREERVSKPIPYPSNRDSMSRWYPKSGGKPLSPLSARLYSAGFLAPDNMADPAALAHPEAPAGPASYTNLSGKQRAVIEAAIDGEYVPFSIQDLRTNEIISLPAFITNVTDDFAVDHSSTHGFGRTDEIKIYRKTTRNVGFTFQLVAMNQEDHEYIWYVANRFVSMVYPQRAQGRRRRISQEAGGVIEFSQPFSQTITASPVVRIRIGDVIASNASLSGFTQIFGNPVSLKESSTSSPEAAKKSQEVARGITAFNKVKKMKYANDLKKFRSTFAANSGVMAMLPTGVKEHVIKKGTNAYVEFESKYYAFKTQHDLIVAPGKRKNEAKEGQKKEIWVHEFNLASYVTDEQTAMALGGTPLLAAYRKAAPLFPNPFVDGDPILMRIPRSESANMYFEDNVSAQRMITNQQFVDSFAGDRSVDAAKAAGLVGDDAEMRPGADELMKKVKQEVLDLCAAAKVVVEDSSMNSIIDGTGIRSFMNPASNPIVRSFNVSGGQGLAGVITQLTFDYSDALWGTTNDSPGGEDLKLRAPKLITVTVQFSPIHDLPLGLNYKGEMFAPSHPVGALSAHRLDSNISTAKEKMDLQIAQRKQILSKLPDTSNPGEPKLPF